MRLVSYLVEGEPRYGAAIDSGVVDLTQRLGPKCPDLRSLIARDGLEVARQMVAGLKFHGRFERPTDRRADLPIALAEVGIGIYRGSAETIAPGQWDLVLEGAAAGQRMFLSKNRVLLN